MYYIYRAETGWFYTHKNPTLSQGNLAYNPVWRKGMEGLLLLSPSQERRKDPRRCFSEFQLLGFKTKTLQGFSQHKASKQSQQTSNRHSSKERCRAPDRGRSAHEGALLTVVTAHLLRSLHAVSLQKSYACFHCAAVIELKSI